MKSFTHFNAWDEVINSESETGLSSSEKSELKLIKTTYFSNKEQGIFIFTDNKGYITLIKKHSKVESGPNSPVNHKIQYLKRAFSTFNDINLIRQQQYLTIFGTGNKIGFMRAFDGQMGESQCVFNSTQIVSLEFDKNKAGIFYILDSEGDILIINAKSKNKNEVQCEISGKIINNAEEHTEMMVLDKMIVGYSENSNSFILYNVTGDEEGRINYNKITGELYTPEFESYGLIKG